MSDNETVTMERKAIREFFIESAEKLIENNEDLEGKIPIDLLCIVRFENGPCKVLWSKDRVIRVGLFEELKMIWKEEGLY